MSDELKLLLERMREDGIATGAIKDGRVLAITKKKLQELLATIEESGQNECIILIKSPDKIN